MKRRPLHIILWIISISAAVRGPLALAQDQCRTCHEAIGDTASTLFKRDIHLGKGISCADCHGGDARKEEMEEAMSKSAGYTGVPKGDEISTLCARCHAVAAIMVKKYRSTLSLEQAELLSTSVHGKLSINGKERIAQCTTCHGSHGIVGKDNPASPVYPPNVVKTCAKCHANAAYVRTYNPSLPVDQLDKYRTSIHGMRNAKGDAKVAECASCHGSHDIRSAKDVKSAAYDMNVPATCSTCHSSASYMKGYKIPVDQFEKYTKSVHGIALLQKHDLAAPACNDCHGNHGATPPGVQSISKICGSCHALNADLFSKSPHKRAFDQKNLPECETCHGYHDIVVATDKLLGVSAEAVCSWCHGGAPTSKAYLVAKKMRQLIDSLGSSESAATLLVDEAERKGMEIGEARFKLRDARQARLESRTMVHSFDEQQFQQIVDKGLKVASEVSEEANNAIEEYYFRRQGLGIATLIITVLAVSLYAFIRRLERGQGTKQ